MDLCVSKSHNSCALQQLWGSAVLAFIILWLHVAFNLCKARKVWSCAASFVHELT